MQTVLDEASDRDGAKRHESDHARLTRLIRQEGLLDRRPGYYTFKIIANATLFAAGWIGFAFLGNTWYQLLIAAFMAVLFTHIAFLGHDIGHRQVFRTRRAAEVAGMVHGNLTIGLSRGWWVDKHNRHHSHPNHVGKDPDIAEGVVAWTSEQAGRRRGAGRFLVRRQGQLFFPLLLLEGLNLHVSSIRALKQQPVLRRRIEGGLLLVHGVAYLGALFAVLPPGKAVAFLAVHKAVFGLYMGSTFAPNHKGMPIFGADEKIDYLRRQVLTSRNVRGGRLTDFLLGGLNYQIEHHLFPSMPRPCLRRARPIVQAYCRDHDIAYCETGLLTSYRQALRYLNEVGA
jgi:fatty acid desaturase